MFSFFLFIFKEKVTKICDQDGNWFRHPASNRTWTNYTQCNVNTHEKVKVHNTYKLKLNLHLLFKKLVSNTVLENIQLVFHSIVKPFHSILEKQNEEKYLYRNYYLFCHYSEKAILLGHSVIYKSVSLYQLQIFQRKYFNSVRKGKIFICGGISRIIFRNCAHIEGFHSDWQLGHPLSHSHF